jgi:hypothetical protein
MSQKNRPDAISRAQMPASSRSNPAMPIIIGILTLLLLLLIFLIFAGIIPFEVKKGDIKEDARIEAAVNLAEQRAMQNVNATGEVIPDTAVASPDPILTHLEQPFDVAALKEET